MDSTLLAPAPLDGAKKQRAIQDAKNMYDFIVRSAERAQRPVPPYDFLELIGKGGSGRVYKCRKRADGELVAIKIINTDEIDYAQHAFDKDDTIRDFKKEVNILEQLKDSNAKNVNMIHDAFAFQEQLWIVCDYCTGGSVRTLLRARTAMNTGLEEHFIIPIARELAWAMKSVHDIGIIHRDIKCTNVYVNERGDIQLGDFGIVGIADDGVSKRRTIIGTPHYMPPELHLPSADNQAPQAYGKEIDIWSFGCSVYEMATGQPPHSHVTNINELNQYVLQEAPRLDGSQYSPDLCDFVAFCLTRNPQERPTASDILRHPYIVNTQKRFPTSNLVRLIERYKLWEMGGGQRVSLWMPGGAPDVPSAPMEEESTEEGDDWNFSTSDDFDEAFDKRYSQMMVSGSGVAQAPNPLPPLQTSDLSVFERHMQQREERSANRGEVSLQRLWNPDSSPYELHTPASMFGDDDLPLRSAQSAPARESSLMIDLDEGAMDPAFHFEYGSDMPTLKARRSRQSMREDEDDDHFSYHNPDAGDEKRATMDWTFPKRATMDWTFPKAADEQEPPDPTLHGHDGELPEGFRPILKHTVTVPVGQFGDYLHTTNTIDPPVSYPVRNSVESMIDLDLSVVDPAELPRPSTAGSATGSTMTDMTSGNPFDLEDDPQQNEDDRNRYSYHKQWQSEGGGQVKRYSRKNIPMHDRGSSLSSTDSELDHMARSDSTFFDKRRVPTAIRRPHHQQTTSDATDTDSEWPSFESGLSAGNQNISRPIDTSRSPGRSLDLSRLDSSTRSHQPEIDFPSLNPPRPDALIEDADLHVVSAEMARLLDEFSSSLAATMSAMKQYTGWSDQEDLLEADVDGRDNDSGLDGGDELK